VGQDEIDEDAVTSGSPTLEDVVGFVLDQPAPARSLSGLVNLASVGTVLHAWRYSPLEDAHASAWCPLTDGEMMRTNGATTCLVRELFVAFFAGVLGVAVPPLSVKVTAAANGAADDGDLP
jgi:hypothetical protein